MTRSDPVGDARILSAAEHVFVEKGYREASMHDIAAEAGVSTPRLYLSHGSKVDLFAASVVAAISKLTAPDRPTDALDPETAQGTRFSDFLRRVSDDPTHWQHYEQATTDPEFPEDVSLDIRERLVAQLIPALRMRQGALWHSTSSTVFVASAVIGAVESIATKVARDEVDVETATDLLDQLTSFPLNNLSVTPAHRDNTDAEDEDEDETLENLVDGARAGIADGWATAIDKYGVISAGRISEMLDTDRLATEQELQRQTRSGELICLAVEDIDEGRRVVVYPRFQFDGNGTVLPVMSQFAARVAEKWDTETRLLWLTSPNGWLGAEAPADLLATQPDAVLRALDLAMNAA
jgi:AcrR family transcriptional regulator